jgi:hypothetical protein
MTHVRYAVLLVQLLRTRVGADAPERERGDVPGWVLITLMTAAIVAVLWTVAGPTLTDLFKSAVCNTGISNGSCKG